MKGINKRYCCQNLKWIEASPKSEQEVQVGRGVEGIILYSLLHVVTFGMILQPCKFDR
jgi:hypothetical protein